MSGCHPLYVDMPVCEHTIPMKFSCLICKRLNISSILIEFNEQKERINNLEKQLFSIKDHFISIQKYMDLKNLLNNFNGRLENLEKIYKIFDE
jgi:hypothetical protein